MRDKFPLAHPNVANRLPLLQRNAVLRAIGQREIGKEQRVFSIVAALRDLRQSGIRDTGLLTQLTTHTGKRILAAQRRATRRSLQITGVRFLGRMATHQKIVAVGVAYQRLADDMVAAVGDGLSAHQGLFGTLSLRIICVPKLHDYLPATLTFLIHRSGAAITVKPPGKP